MTSVFETNLCLYKAIKCNILGNTRIVHQFNIQYVGCKYNDISKRQHFFFNNDRLQQVEACVRGYTCQQKNVIFSIMKYAIHVYCRCFYCFKELWTSLDLRSFTETIKKSLKKTKVNQTKDNAMNKRKMLSKLKIETHQSHKMRVNLCAPD